MELNTNEETPNQPYNYCFKTWMDSRIIIWTHPERLGHRPGFFPLPLRSFFSQTQIAIIDQIKTFSDFFSFNLTNCFLLIVMTSTSSRVKRAVISEFSGPLSTSRFQQKITCCSNQGTRRDSNLYQTGKETHLYPNKWHAPTGGFMENRVTPVFELL